MEKSTRDETNISFRFCDGKEPIESLNRTFTDFAAWYASTGRLTTGPKRVYIGVEMRSKFESGTCLRLVDEELYWPGSYSWIPLCESAAALIA